jgi:hypothetical protein
MLAKMEDETRQYLAENRMCFAEIAAALTTHIPHVRGAPSTPWDHPGVDRVTGSVNGSVGSGGSRGSASGGGASVSPSFPSFPAFPKSTKSGETGGGGGVTIAGASPSFPSFPAFPRSGAAQRKSDGSGQGEPRALNPRLRPEPYP